MRSLLYLSAIILISVSCTHQKEIEQYQKQLKESNLFLENTAKDRIALFNQWQAENPYKATKWAKKAHGYYSKCQQLIYANSKNQMRQHVVELQKLQSMGGFNDPICNLLYITKGTDSILFKNQILLHLNCYLKQLSLLIGHSDSWSFFEVTAQKISLGDSTLVLLNANFRNLLPEFVVSFENPDMLNFQASTSIGYLYLPHGYEDSTISGEVTFFIEHSPDTKQYQFEIDGGSNNSNRLYNTSKPPQSLK